MNKPDIHLVDETHEIERQFRSVMRRLAGGVSIITAGRDDDITGMTVTSLTSLSANPPRLLVASTGRRRCEYRKPRSGCSGDGVRPEWQVT
jgi:flavin reductase (DIM6/NTAB) family NADH-FMN oxidoreductase RutF